jgi:hypothetical protein
MLDVSVAVLSSDLSCNAELRSTMMDNTTPVMNPKRSEITENTQRLEKIGLSLAI